LILRHALCILGFNLSRSFFLEIANRIKRFDFGVEAPAERTPAADAEGDELAILSGLEKPSQSFTDKYPVLVTGFFCFLCGNQGWIGFGEHMQIGNILSGRRLSCGI